MQALPTLLGTQIGLSSRTAVKVNFKLIGISLLRKQPGRISH